MTSSASGTTRSARSASTSTFAEDIQLESMEVMEVAERLIEEYEGRVDFVAWFADMELEDLIEITVGSVVDFIVASLEGDRPVGVEPPMAERRR